jgi:uncharacterized membrane protein
VISLTSLATDPPQPAPSLRSSPSDDLPAEASWAERAWWTLAGIALINWAVQLLGAESSFWWAAALVLFGGAWGLGTVIVSLVPDAQSYVGPRTTSVFAWLTAGVCVLMFFAWAFVQVHASSNYGTDEIAFDQYAAQLAQHGLNPYVHSLAAAFSTFRVSPDGYTYTLTGTPVLQLSYPALSFLVYVPFLLLGWSNQMAVVVNVFALAAAVLLMFAFLPRRMRAAALVLGSVTVYASYAAGGVTDALYMPLLVIAAYRWDRFGESRATYIGPVMLGLAMAVKQTPWPLLLFVIAAIVCDEFDRSGFEAAVKRGTRYATVVVMAFMIPNLPYFFASPTAWYRGVLTPLIQNLVPSGQGAIVFSLFLHVGGGSLAAFSFATALLAILLVIAYVGTFPLLRSATFALPALILFFSARSDPNYLVSLLPVAMIAAVTARPPQPQRFGTAGDFGGQRLLWPTGLQSAGRFTSLQRLLGTVGVNGPLGPIRSRRWASALLACAVLFLATMGYALAASPPLKLRITGIRSTGIALSTIGQLTVRATNTSGSAVRPYFTVQNSIGDTTFWQVAAGPRTLAPDESANYTLESPNAAAQPSLTGGFSVLAFTTSPASVSVSNRYLPSRLHLVLEPQAFDQPVPVGTTLTIKAYLLGHLNERVYKAGVRVTFSQTIHANIRGEKSLAIINGHAPGDRRVVEYTNSDGVATFSIVGTQPNSYPTSFVAGLYDTGAEYNYGISERVDVRFAPAAR